MRLSVIVPVYNEAARLPAALAALAAQPGIDEVIVVDGDSDDGSADLARAAGATLVRAPRGRGTQLNAGAAAASGDVLLFLHADVDLPAGAAAIVARALADPRVVAGAFRTWTVVHRRRWLAPLVHIADVRSRVSRAPYGDQAVFVRAGAFWAAGGFPDVPLMEDIALARALRRIGRIRIVPHRVRVSGRRFEAGLVRATVAMNTFPLLFRLGVPPHVLARLYGAPR